MKKILSLMLAAILIGFVLVSCEEAEPQSSFNAHFNSAADIAEAMGSTNGTWGGDATGALTLEATAGVDGSPAVQLAITGNTDAAGTGRFYGWTNNPVQDGGFNGDQAEAQMSDYTSADITCMVKVSGIPAGGDLKVQFKPIASEGGAPEYTDLADGVSIDPITLTEDTTDFVEKTVTIDLGDVKGDGGAYNAVVLSFDAATGPSSSTTLIIDDVVVEYLK